MCAKAQEEYQTLVRGESQGEIEVKRIGLRE